MLFILCKKEAAFIDKSYCKKLDTEVDFDLIRKHHAQLKTV